MTDILSSQLAEQTQSSQELQSDRTGSTIALADAEIARSREILRQIDELEEEFDKIRHIREIIKAYRLRVESEAQKQTSAARR